MKYLYIAIIGLLTSFYINNIPQTLAFGECDQYGVMAKYNYDGTCSCTYGWKFDNTPFGKRCVSTYDYCRNRMGVMATYDSLYDKCECLAGYVLKRDMFGDLSCMSGEGACHDQLGIHSSYQSFNDKCVCDYGYSIVNGKCVDLDQQCWNQLGYDSSYNVLYDTCECNSGYIIDGGQCKNADIVCRNEHGYYSSYNSLIKKCECDDDYTLDEYGECVEKQHNVYFRVIELDDDNNEAIIKSDYDGSYYHVSYGLGCLSFWRYEDKQIVVNLGTDYSLDTWDKIVLQDNNQTCNIVTKERVYSGFSLKEEDEELAEEEEEEEIINNYYVPTPTQNFEEVTVPAPIPSCPPNSTLIGDTCTCNEDYTSFNDACFKMPANAHAVISTTDAWECDDGFIEEENGCIPEPVSAPTVTSSSSKSESSIHSLENESDSLIVKASPKPEKKWGWDRFWSLFFK
ncbi:hypothetical protein KJ652_06120 [Patescibacteria group bacterium]|nr:hypothetical protein [Patescibacteria group bacterium]